MTVNPQYNQRQIEAINASEDNIVITAPPGSGKTTSIIGAIQKYMNENANEHIVAVTYTRKAAEELGQRLSQPANGCQIEISTIHSWSYRQLEFFAARYGFVVSLLQEEMIRDILLRICRKRSQYYIHQPTLYSYVMGNFNLDVDESLLHTMESIRQSYINFKRLNDLYDFTDLPLYLYNILQEYNEEIYNIDAFFVDEFQDVDNIQLEIFNRVHAKKKVYIGDRKQSIYIFRGASEEAFDNLTGFTDYYLDTNYRSYQEIIDYADSINYYAGAALDINSTLDIDALPDVIFDSNIHCAKGYGGFICVAPDTLHAVNLSTNTEINIADFSNMLRSLIQDKHTQILCRANKQVKKIKSYDIENVSTVHQAKGLEYDNVIVVSFTIDNEEEKNIAYVAMTRAKNKLIVIDYQTLLYFITTKNISHSNKLF